MSAAERIFIRQYQATDAQEICKLLDRALAPYGLQSDFNKTDKDILQVKQYYIDPGGTFQVLVEDEKLIGMYGLFKLNEQTCELRKMYLEPSCKGRGLGKRLMNDALERARVLGFSEMHLETNACLHEAVRMYQRYGFEIIDSNHLSERCDTAMRLRL